ncbi:MAG: purine-nucleoside phosphorylase [Vampirovibrionales bacterium]|nr:purine-nucleoside phosphorylase [Vampirovibrionales bacterium]
MSPWRAPLPILNLPQNDLAQHLASAKALVQSRYSTAPKIGLILGSGLGGWVSQLQSPEKISFSSLAGFPKASVAGHAGQLVMGKLFNQLDVACLAGRVHLYEGYTASQVAYPVRLLAALGVRLLIVTNSSGGIRPEFNAGDLVMIEDHLNLMGQNPLTGFEAQSAEQTQRARFVDMTEPYSPVLRQALKTLAKEHGVKLKTGVYAGVPGPSYETPAEVRMLEALGADLVGMSTVPEVIVARQLGLHVLGLSCVSNKAAHVGQAPLSHAEVIEAGKASASQMGQLINALLYEMLPTLQW